MVGHPPPPPPPPGRDRIKMRDYMEKWVTPPKRVTSPTWGPSPPCKQAVRLHLYGEKLYRTEGSPLYSSYPGRAKFFYISLQNLAQPFT